MRIRLLWHCCGFSFALAYLASASQVFALDWALVPYGVPEPGAATRAAEKLGRALVERRISVASMHEAKDLMAARSRPAARVDSRQHEAVATLRKEALDHAAFGRRESARRAGEEALSIALRAPETLLHDSDVARDAFDACLALVRVDLQERDRQRALKDALRCRALVPDLTPRESTHPAEVIGVLAEAENSLRRAGAAVLTVSSADEQSCVAFVNGRRMGTTPYRFEHAPLGTVAIVLECGSRVSRVHMVELGESELTLTINPQHDATVSDRDVLGLVYASESELTSALTSDVRTLGEELRARQLVLVRTVTTGPVSIVRYDVARQRVVASVEIDAKQVSGTELGAFREAAEALVLERMDAPLPAAFSARVKPSDGNTNLPPQGVARAEPSSAAVITPVAQPVPPTRARTHGRAWTWSLGAAALTATAVAAGLAVATQAKGRELDNCNSSDASSEECAAVGRKGRRLELARNTTTGLAAALASAAFASFFLERRYVRQGSDARITLQVLPMGLGASGTF